MSWRQGGVFWKFGLLFIKPRIHNSRGQCVCSYQNDRELEGDCTTVKVRSLYMHGKQQGFPKSEAFVPTYCSCHTAIFHTKVKYFIGRELPILVSIYLQEMHIGHYAWGWKVWWYTGRWSPHTYANQLWRGVYKPRMRRDPLVLGTSTFIRIARAVLCNKYFPCAPILYSVKSVLAVKLLVYIPRLWLCCARPHRYMRCHPKQRAPRKSSWKQVADTVPLNVLSRSASSPIRDRSDCQELQHVCSYQF